MVLELDGDHGIFSHSERTNTGGGKERIGQATILVSKDGSGDTDDIQEAINMLPSGGGTIFIKDGTYNLTSRINLDKENVTLQGTGRGSIITTAEDDDLIYITGNFCTIRDLYFIGANTAANVNQNITISSADDCTIMNCWSTKADWYGIYLINGGARNMIINNWCYDNNRDGIRVSTSDNIISGNMCRSNTMTGITITPGSYNVVSNNVCNSNTTEGIEILNADNNIVVGNILHNNSNDGLVIGGAGAQDNLFIGNNFFGNLGTQVTDTGSDTLPNAATGTTNLTESDLNIID